MLVVKCLALQDADQVLVFFDPGHILSSEDFVLVVHTQLVFRHRQLCQEQILLVRRRQVFVLVLFDQLLNLRGFDQRRTLVGCANR